MVEQYQQRQLPAVGHVDMTLLLFVDVAQEKEAQIYESRDTGIQQLFVRPKPFFDT